MDKLDKRHFKVKKVINISDLKEGDIVGTSDYVVNNNEKFIQFEYIRSKRSATKVEITPGIHKAISTMAGLQLVDAGFKNDKLLESFDNTKEIIEKVDCFLRNMDIYKELGRDDVKRCMLLYGPPGTGKTASVSVLAKKYVADGETAVLIWKTDVIDADSMKDFISNFEYKGVKKLFFIAEDIGGVEVEDARIASKSSLLSLLDNQEKTFTIPTLIIATTNFPGMFLANIANRPQRFDDKIKMDYPSSEARKELFKFIGKDRVTNEDIEYVAESKFKQFTPAHLQEIVIRSAIYEQAIKKTMDDMVEEIEQYNKGYTDRNSVGIK